MSNEEKVQTEEESLRLKRMVFLGVSGVVIGIIGARVQYRRRNQQQIEKDFLESIPAPNSPEAYAMGRVVAARAFKYGTLLCATGGILGVAWIRYHFGVETFEEFGWKMKEIIPKHAASIRGGVVAPLEDSLTQFYERVFGKPSNLHLPEEPGPNDIQFDEKVVDKWWADVKKAFSDDQEQVDAGANTTPEAKADEATSASTPDKK